jgi:hypothetical protein
MRKLLALVVLVTLNSGCAMLGSPKDDEGKVVAHDLDSVWRPLEDVRERPRVVRDLGSATVTTTVGRHCYVKDLDEWLTRVVPGSAKYKALLRHEQEHSRRQLAMGTFLWVARYSYDREFALLEEQIGYFYEITERRRLGNPMNVDRTAIVFSRYKILSGKLISFDDAKAWILDVLAGRWTPPLD